MNRLESLDPVPKEHTSNGNGHGVRKNGRHSNGQGDEPVRYLEIGDTGRRRYIVGLAAYLLFFLVVAAALVYVFLYFTPNVALAVGLVAFMIAYMVIMGWLASRNIERREQDDRF